MSSDRQALKLAEPHAEMSLAPAVVNLAAELAGEGAFSAPVHMPPQDQLAVRLVNVAVLDRLDEARDDANSFQNMFWGFFGVTIGVPVSFAISSGGLSQINEGAVITLLALGLATTGIGLLWRKYSRRAAALKEKLMKEATYRDVAS